MGSLLSPAPVEWVSSRSLGRPAVIASWTGLYVFTARCYAERGYARVSCPSVCPSATLRYVFHTGWNTSKIISRPNSLKPLLGLTPTWEIWCNGKTPKIRVELGWGHSGSQKTCNISETVQDRTKVAIWRTNRKSYTRFRLVPKSTTLDDQVLSTSYYFRNV